MRGPKCPNHSEVLELDAIQKTQTSGRSPCSVSGVMFEWTQDVQVIEYDKFGQPIKKWLVHGKD